MNDSQEHAPDASGQPDGGQPHGGQPEAKFKPSRWPGWIWVVPVAALAMVAWFGIRDFMQQGPGVTVSFPRADGVQSGNTKVQYNGMVVGEVESVHIAKDLSHVDLKLQMHANMDGHLGPGTEYWIAGQSFNPNDLSTLKTIISGPYIAVQPHPGDTVDKVQGLAKAPVLKERRKGREFMLESDRLGGISQGTPVYFLGMEVGEVLDYRLEEAKRRFAIEVFVDSPYDALVRPQTRFWNAGPLHLASTPSGPSVQLQSVSALLKGAIAFSTPANAPPGESQPKAGFTLYPDRETAQNAPTDAGVSYAVVFPDTASGLEVGAPVKLMDRPVGSVSASTLEYDAAKGSLSTRATIVISPDKLAVANAAPAGGGDKRATMDAAIRRMVANGLRAELATAPPLVGAPLIRLRFVPDAGPADLQSGSPPVIPSGGGGDIGGLMTQAGDIMTKLDNLPLNQIADEVHQTTSRLAQLSNSPELTSSLQNLDDTMQNVRSVTADARRQVEPILADVRKAAVQAQDAARSAHNVLGGRGNLNSAQSAELPQTLYELTRTARSLRELADYLDRHPEALIQGKSR